MATDTATKAQDIASVLKDETVPLKSLLAKGVKSIDLAKAWSAGDIEFGRRTHVTMGKAGCTKTTTLIVEKGIAWTGPKTVGMKGFKDLAAEDDRLPKAKEYKEYPEPKEDAEPVDEANAKSPMLPLTESQAHSLIGLHVRLTDRGLAALQNAA